MSSIASRIELDSFLKRSICALSISASAEPEKTIKQSKILFIVNYRPYAQPRPAGYHVCFPECRDRQFVDRTPGYRPLRARVEVLSRARHHAFSTRFPAMSDLRPAVDR